MVNYAKLTAIIIFHYYLWLHMNRSCCCSIFVLFLFNEIEIKSSALSKMKFHISSSKCWCNCCSILSVYRFNVCFKMPDNDLARVKFTCCNLTCRPSWVNFQSELATFGGRKSPTETSETWCLGTKNCHHLMPCE